MNDREPCDGFGAGRGVWGQGAESQNTPAQSTRTVDTRVGATPEMTLCDELPGGHSQGVLVFDGDDRVVCADLSAEALLGWKRAELAGEPLGRFFSEGLEGALRIVRFAGSQRLDTAAYLDFAPVTAIRADGSPLEVSVRLSLLPQGVSAPILCAIRPTSDASVTDERLHGDEARFRQLYRAFPLPTYVWQHRDGGFILTDYNGAGGLHDGDLSRQRLGSRPSAVFSEQSDFERDMWLCFAQRNAIEREYTGYRATPSDPPKDLLVLFVWAEPDLVMVVVDDVTDERAALDEIRRLSSAVEQTADAVFMTGPDGVIEYVNPAFEQITGFLRREAIGQTPRILKSGQMAPEYYRGMWNTLLAGEPFRGQTTNRRRDGTLFVAEQTVTPLKDGSGKVTHFVSVLKDMTERMRLQERETEQRLAGLVQRRLFPTTTPRIPGYDIAGAVFPAVETSGDYFDYVNMPGGATGIVVADVCGHGLGPAILMAETRAFIRSTASREGDPREVLRELNRQIEPDLSDGSFITAVVARLDPHNHLLASANAGNWPVYVLDAAGRVVAERRTDGVPVGVFPDLILRPASPTRLEAGSLALLTTDGIPEAVDARGRPFGVRRLLAVVRRHRRAPAGEIIDRVREALRVFVGTAEQADDQTLVIIKRQLEG